MTAPGPKAWASSFLIKAEASPLPFPGTTVSELPSIKTLSLSPMLRADWATATDTGPEIRTMAPAPISRALSLVITDSIQVVFHTGSKRISLTEGKERGSTDEVTRIWLRRGVTRVTAVHLVAPRCDARHSIRAPCFASGERASCGAWWCQHFSPSRPTHGRQAHEHSGCRSCIHSQSAHQGSFKRNRSSASRG